jgi:hypothetical protein
MGARSCVVVEVSPYSTDNNVYKNYRPVYERQPDRERKEQNYSQTPI